MKARSLFLLFLLSYNVANLFAQQWSYRKSFPKSISFTTADHDSFGSVYALSTEGQVWFRAASSDWAKFPDFPVANFRDIMVNNENGTVYFADEGGGLVFTVNNGLNWQQVWLQTNPTSGFHESLTTLSNINFSGAFYSGGIGALFPFSPTIFRYFIAENGIATIEEIAFDPTNGSNSTPISIIQSKDGNIVIVGTSGQGFFTSVNGGSSFTNHMPGLTVFAICSGPNNSFYALARATSDGLTRLMKSNDGVGWSVFSEPLQQNETFTSLYFDTALTELWVGTSSSIYKVSDLVASNATFISQIGNNLPANSTTISKSDDKICLFSPQYTFQTKENSLWVQDLTGIKGLSKQLIFDTADNLYSIDYTTSNIAVTNENSPSWTNMVLPGNFQIGLQDLQRDGLDNIFTRKQNNIYKVNDAGDVTTIPLPMVSGGNVMKFYVSNSSHLFLVHSSDPARLYFSDNDGTTWDVFQQLEEFNSFSSIAVDLNETVYFTTSNDLTAFFYKMVGSDTWTRVEYDANSDGGCDFTQNDIYTSGSQVFFRVCGKTFLLDSMEIGAQIQSPLGPFITSVGQLYSFGNSLYTVANENDINRVYKSVDNGVSWTNMGCPPELGVYPNSLYNILLNSVGEVFVQTNPFIDLPDHVAGIYKLTENLSSPDFGGELDITLYPNPGKDILNIRSSMPVHNMVVMDVAGRMIQQINGSRNFLDISNYSAGTYLIRIETRLGGVQILKFIKM